jgi:transcriptional/translational regulatory protein YebC/TACO1
MRKNLLAVQAAIREAQADVHDAQDRLQGIVDRARQQGFTWEQIAASINSTKQNAQQRFG